VRWLASHDPTVCQWDKNDVMIGYCGPHYYASLCEDFPGLIGDYESGSLHREFLDEMHRIKGGREPNVESPK